MQEQLQNLLDDDTHATVDRMNRLVNEKRVRVLKAGKVGTGPVIYWCSRDQRVRDNWALIYACETANETDAPVVVVFSLVTRFLGAGARQFCFMLKGLREMEQALLAKNIKFVLLEGEPSLTVPRFAKECGASLIVADQSPLRLGRTWRVAVASSVDCPLHEVDAHNIVPVWEASQKLEVGARTLRGKLAKLYPEFLVEFPETPVVKETWPCEAAAALPTIAIDWEALIVRARNDGSAVPEVTWAVPGEFAAHATLEHFLTRRLKYYEHRNDPAKPQALSGLSPYLHFGQISAQRCALEARRYAKSSIKAVDVFLEELIVRRELADNFCWYSPKYDTIEGQKYEWAKATVREHSKDKRAYLYSLQQFENGETHDDLWNAAQLEMVHGGKMHGFMRMYWAKKIMEWTESPDQALEFAIYLNDKYQLDGRDPSGYVGCMWSIVGVHDQGWSERPIFGKIRYMAYSGCVKKFKVQDYIKRVDELVTAVKAGEKNTSVVNPGRFHIAFSSSLDCDSLAVTGSRVCSEDELQRFVRVASANARSNTPRSLEALRALKSVDITAETLMKTGVAKEVKKLSKQRENPSVSSAAAAIVQAWQKLLLP